MEAYKQFQSKFSIKESNVEELLQLQQDTFLFVLSWKCPHCQTQSKIVNRLVLLNFLKLKQQIIEPMSNTNRNQEWNLVPNVRWILGNSSENFGSSEKLQEKLNIMPKTFPAIYYFESAQQTFTPLPIETIVSSIKDQSIARLIDWRKTKSQNN